MISLAFSVIPKEISKDTIKKEAELFPASFLEKNTAYINDILNKKHLPSIQKSLISLKLLLLSLAEFTDSVPILFRDENGRPHFENIDNIDFSLSHSDDLAVCALCISDKSGRVGVDTENIFSKDPTPLSNRFFADGEKKLIQDAVDKNRVFTELWTKKEAYIKHLGTGLGTPLCSFDVTTDLGLHFETLEIKNNIVSVCADVNDFPLKIKEL